MVVWVIADNKSLMEWPAHNGNGQFTVTAVTACNDVKAVAEDVVVDLLFDNSQEQIERLLELNARLIVINHVVGDLSSLPANCVRINAWPGFLQRTIVEASTLEQGNKEIAATVFNGFDKKIEWVPDIPGFFTARVIACMINEAYFALQEAVSTREEIDTAMKLGTNYPYGPFEWADKIGPQQLLALLNLLSEKESIYQPARLLVKTASNP